MDTSEHGWGRDQHWVYGEAYAGLVFVPRWIAEDFAHDVELAGGLSTIGDLKAAREQLRILDLAPDDEDIAADELDSTEPYDWLEANADNLPRLDVWAVDHWGDVEQLSDLVKFIEPMMSAPIVYVAPSDVEAVVAKLVELGYSDIERDDSLIARGLV